jgi:hypothetical protein
VRDRLSQHNVGAALVEAVMGKMLAVLEVKY